MIISKIVNYQENAWWFIVAQEQILLQPEGDLVPYGCLQQLSLQVDPSVSKVKIGEFKGSPCYLINLQKKSHIEFAEYRDLRVLLGEIEDPLFDLAGRALQIALFYNTHQYCGQCGSTMTAVDWEIACQCQQCQHRCYPRVSPCMIVAIRKEDKILLALHQRHYQSGIEMYTTLAGFTEAGESLEDCIHREVFEEVALKVKNIRYVSSQPWPFPHSLMMGYTAEYESGEIKVDANELHSAAWYAIDDLPVLSNKGTVARKLINKVLTECETYNK